MAPKHPAKSGESELKLIVKNRRATFDYHVDRRVECGLVLLGTEVKSLRNGQVNLSDGYAQEEKNELWLLNVNISAYANSGPAMNHAPIRKRKLILHRKELDDLAAAVAEKGHTLVPLSLYWKNGKAKVELGLCRGKDHADQRQAIQARESKREIDRAMRGGKRGGSGRRRDE